MAEHLESLVAGQKLLLGDVSHELRSPLARLSVALELPREDAPMSMLENLERIERETVRLSLLIGQLLRLSSLEAPNMGVEKDIARNAIRYTKEASLVQVALSCSVQGEQRVCLLTISDRGPGLPENELQNIFRPFYRVDTARPRDTGGFGIGLAIAERAIRLHGGEIYAINRDGGGISMIIALPCDRSSVA